MRSFRSLLIHLSAESDTFILITTKSLGENFQVVIIMRIRRKIYQDGYWEKIVFSEHLEE